MKVYVKDKGIEKWREVPEGSSYRELLAEKEEKNSVLLALANGKLQEMNSIVSDGEQISFLSIRDKAGHNTYVRSLLLLVLRALSELAGEEAAACLETHFIVSGGCYCTIPGKDPLSEEFLNQLSQKMKELVLKKLPIQKKQLTTAEARKYFAKCKMQDKERLFYYRRASWVNLYELDGYIDYFYGYMVPDTGCLELFSLKGYEQGFVLLYPSRKEPDHLPEFQPASKLFHTQQTSMEWARLMKLDTVADLNDYHVFQSIQDLILLQEAFHEKQIAEIASSIAKDPGKRIVLIAGPSSSGKTTFSHRLSTQLAVHGLQPHPIAVDNYYRNREDTPRDADGKYDFECLEALDLETFNHDIRALLAGEKVSLPTFNFKTGKREYRGNSFRMGKQDILVIEGIHCLNPRLTQEIPEDRKYRIYISALTQLKVDEHNRIPTTDTRLLRRIIRDARTRNTGARETIAMWPSVRRGEEQYIFPWQEQADVMFNSALIYELAVLKLYAEPLLFSVPEDSEEYLEANRLLKFLDYFTTIPTDQIPVQSLLREFIGGGCFDI